MLGSRVQGRASSIGGRKKKKGKKSVITERRELLEGRFFSPHKKSKQINKHK
jgi:hypothetical protein